MDTARSVEGTGSVDDAGGAVPVADVGVSEIGGEEGPDRWKFQPPHAVPALLGT